ncbi:MAG: divergent polysaccharide deacetylase family protein [Candidatus Omnitrophica bacterium]|nr:divergent polysaccharide deacetylase family protein [Candidatus Omnitrophota bacterium]
MKIKIVLAAVTIGLILGIAFIFWKSSHVPKRKIIIVKKAPAPARKVAKKRKFVAVQKKHSSPKVAIVIDDFGYNMNNIDRLLAIKKAVTFSVLPNLPYSKKIASLASSKGYEVILHLPLESVDSSAPAEIDTIKTDMGEKDISAVLEKDIASVPGLSGVSNHQGSKATEDKRCMSIVLSGLKKRSLYFFDSLVTDKSVCRMAAARWKVPYAKRDIFLDNENNPEYIEKQMLSLRKMAFKYGSVIAVCHDRKNTIAVLSKMMPELAEEGIQFVYLSEMVK